MGRVGGSGCGKGELGGHKAFRKAKDGANPRPGYLEKEQSPASAARGHEELRLSQFINRSSVCNSFMGNHLQDKELELLFVECVSDTKP